MARRSSTKRDCADASIGSHSSISGGWNHARKSTPSPAWTNSKVERRPPSQALSDCPSTSVRHLLQDCEIAGIPCLNDNVKLIVHLAQHGIMNVLEILEAQVVLWVNCGNQFSIFQNVNGRASTRVGAIQRRHHCIMSQVIDVARQGAGRHFQRSEVMTVARESLNLGMRAVGNVKLLCTGHERDAVRRPKLRGSVTFAAKRQIVPHGAERI